MKMSDFDYRKYSLSKLEDWVCDAISTADATPQEVYDTIVSAITEYHDHHKKGFEYTTELLGLLNNNKKWDEWEETYYPEEYKGSTVSSSQYETKNGVNYNQYVKAKIEANSAWNDGWTREYFQTIVDKYEGKKDKVVKWRLPVEEDESSGEYFITFPDDLLEAADLKEGDTVEWVDNLNGSFTLKKVEKQMTHDEMLDAGYWMTDDGFWIKQ
jgi:hypothetical protein